MKTSGFYKIEGGEIICAPNFVEGPGVSLRAEDRASYTYPVDGWAWFDSYAQALAALANPHNPRHITKLAFRSRFTPAEKVGIEIAQLDNPAATMPERANAAALRASQADLAVATYIDLDRADTRAGVLALEQFGLLAKGRALQILDTPTVESEWFTG